MVTHGQSPIFYFDHFGVETPPLFLKDYVDLGSNERIQEYDESYCGADCLFMIYLIDNGYRMKSALNTLVNQVKCPGAFIKCRCLCCKVKVDVNENDKDNVNDNINVNDNVNGNINVNVKDNVNDGKGGYARGSPA